MKKTLTIVAVIMLLAASTFANAEEQSGGTRTYYIGFHFQSTASKSSSNFYDLVMVISDISEEMTGYRIALKKYNSDNDVMEALLSKELDMGMIFPSHIAEIKARGGDVMPWTTYVVNKKRRAATCLWHRRDVSFKDTTEIMGKNLLSSSTDPYTFITLREHLLSLGIDKPLWKVFNSFTLAPSSNSAYMALASGDADLIWGNKDNKYLLKLLVPGVIEKISTSFCTEHKYARGMLVVNKQTVSKEDLEKSKEVVKYFSKNVADIVKDNPKLQAMYQYTKMVKLKFIPAIEKELENDIALYNKSLKNGWHDEAEFILQKLNAAQKGTPVVIKPDFKMCKEWCKEEAKESTMECVETCME